MERDLHCADMGLGVPVVLIHGYPLNHKIWQNQFVLSKHYRILAPDLPGFGETPSISGMSIADYADLILKLLDKENIEKAVVMGHSMGGYIALEFAARYKKRLLGLGLVCTQAGADSEEARANRMKTIERVHAEGKGFVIDTMAGKLTSAKNLSDAELIRQLKSIMQGATDKGIATALKAMAGRSDHLSTLEKIRVPILIIAGAEDALIPVEKSAAMAEKLSKRTFEIISGAGHVAMMEKPEAFNRSLIEFLKKLRIKN